ncbi:MAG: hypothetical protein ACRDYZ_06665 [Acidimicrobiales bacterium]
MQGVDLAEALPGCRTTAISDHAGVAAPLGPCNRSLPVTEPPQVRVRVHPSNRPLERSCSRSPFVVTGRPEPLIEKAEAGIASVNQ